MKEMGFALSCEGDIEFPQTEESRKANLAMDTAEHRHRGGGKCIVQFD